MSPTRFRRLRRRGNPPAKFRKRGGAAPLKTAKELGEKHRLEPYFDFGGRKFFNHQNLYMNQKGFVNIILIVVIVILAGAVGYFVLVKKSAPVFQQSPTPTPASTKTANPSPTSSEQWKQYQNIRNYPLKYPADRQLKESAQIVWIR